MSTFITVNDIRLHYLEYPCDAGRPIILLHGLSANARSFEGIIRAGLPNGRHVVAVDLRGRGLSDKPDGGYALVDHARDIICLMDALRLERVTLAGHSYGGRLAIYLAVHYAERVQNIILLDTGFFHPSVRDLIMPSIKRLDQIVPSWEAYKLAMQQSPPYHGGFWGADVEAYYRADVETLPDGAVKPRSALAHILEIARLAEREDWEDFMRRVVQPAVVLHAPDGFGPGDTPPILTEEGARRAADLMPAGDYVRVTGNHMTMLFGQHAAHLLDKLD